MRQDEANFIVVETSDEGTHSLVVARDGEGRIVISVMSGDGQGEMITLTDEQVAALCAALQEI
jgi:hypothetical protein